MVLCIVTLSLLDTCRHFGGLLPLFSGETDLAGYSEMLVSIYHATQPHILEDCSIKTGHIDSNGVLAFQNVTSQFCIPRLP